MRFGFVTCVQLGLSCMDEIYRCGGELHLAITLPDSAARAKSGRVYLDAFCEQRGIPLVKSPNVNDPAVIAAVQEHKLDWLFVIGWSQIVRAELLAAPTQGALGIHPTLLPQGRGRAAIPWAILKGLDRTGVTLFQLDAGVDTGPVVAQRELPLSGRSTATSLYARVQTAHRELIRDVWPRLADGTARPVPQDNATATEWPGRTPADGAIGASMTVAEVDRLVRATTRPYPGAFYNVPDGRRLRIWMGVPGQEDGERIALKDGWYTALEYEWETASESVQ